MISVSQAQEIIFTEARSLLQSVQGVRVLRSEMVEVVDSVGRVLCQDVVAQDPLPPFPASIKDGYAVISSDGAGVRLVRGASNAGVDPDTPHLTPGAVVRQIRAVNCDK